MTNEPAQHRESVSAWRRPETRVPSRVKLAGLVVGAAASLGVLPGCQQRSNERGQPAEPTATVMAGAEAIPSSSVPTSIDVPPSIGLRIALEDSLPIGWVETGDVVEFRQLRLQQLGGFASPQVQAAVDALVDKYVKIWSAVRPAVVEVLLPQELAPRHSAAFRQGVGGLLDLTSAAGCAPYSGTCAVGQVFGTGNLELVDTNGAIILGAGLRELNAARATFGGRALTAGDLTAKVAGREQSFMPPGVSVIVR